MLSLSRASTSLMATLSTAALLVSSEPARAADGNASAGPAKGQTDEKRNGERPLGPIGRRFEARLGESADLLAKEPFPTLLTESSEFRGAVFDLFTTLDGNAVAGRAGRSIS